MEELTLFNINYGEGEIFGTKWYNVADANWEDAVDAVEAVHKEWITDQWNADEWEEGDLTLSEVLASCALDTLRDEGPVYVPCKRNLEQ
jgi:hypothetical protein